MVSGRSLNWPGASTRPFTRSHRITLVSRSWVLPERIYNSTIHLGEGGGKERGGEGGGGDDRGRITQVDPSESESEIESVQSPAARR